MTTWRMRIACSIPKATNTHTQIVLYSLLFYCNRGCANAPPCYVIRTMSVSLVLVVVYTIFLLLVMNCTSFSPVCLMRVKLYCVVVKSLSRTFFKVQVFFKH